VLSSLFSVLQLRRFLPAASVCRAWADAARAKSQELAVITYVRSLGGASPGGDERLSHPSYALELPQTGEVLVSESATSTLVRMSRDGECLTRLAERGRGQSDLYTPRDLAHDGSLLYIADSQNHRVQRRPLSNLSTAMQNDDVAEDGASLSVMRRPEGLALSATSLYVSDKVACRIYELSVPDLKHHNTFGSRGSGAGELCDPGGLTVLNDEVIVCDVSNHRLQCFARNGLYSRAIGRRGVAPGCFTLPSGITSTDGNVLLVAEKRRVQVLTSQGIPLQVILPAMCGSLQGISCHHSRLLVADSEVRRVHEFSINLVKARMLGVEVAHCDTLS